VGVSKEYASLGRRRHWKHFLAVDGGPAGRNVSAIARRRRAAANAGHFLLLRSG